MLNLGSRKIANLLPNKLITTNGRRSDRSLYLTFDDGPNPEFTLRICDLLDEYSAVGSFFFVGENITQYPLIAREVVDRGHLIANHSDTHRPFKKLNLKSQIEEVEACQSRILEVDSNASKIFRAPRGVVIPTLLVWLKRNGWDVVHWSYDSQDYQELVLDAYKDQFAITSVHPGEILLFHDDNELAVQILRELLPVWSNAGFSFKSVADLLN